MDNSMNGNISGNIYYGKDVIGSFIQTHESGKAQIYLNDKGEELENAKMVARSLIKKYRQNPQKNVVTDDVNDIIIEIKR